ncbi:MAG: ATP/GTP-binding protein [Ramlibacter sp.]|nr:ATP/GTP-binding protein [Ramlibacter sp.]MBX3657185.1 ATP/GTP-binding protein [Ramlibacter sp.]MCW5649379.1 ATP/GTP-binding protein [Ramlibacter sp.]
MIEHKIIFTGTTGAGKTTAIAAVSEITPLNTDVRNTDPEVLKAMTTTGLDYGELTLGQNEKLRLYGTPGQQRFDFMWKVLGRGALGLVILIDNSQPRPLEDLDAYLDGFANLISEGACVIAVGRLDTHPNPGLDVYSLHLEKRNVLCPVIGADVRDATQVIQLLELLLLQLESKTGVSNP